MKRADVALSLAQQIGSLFDAAGATQIERYTALDIARALVSVSGASLIEPADGLQPDSADAPATPSS